MAAPESRGRYAIWILDARTGLQRRLAVRFPGPFTTEFRASWTDGDKALIVTQATNVSHVVLFDRFSISVPPRP